MPTLDIAPEHLDAVRVAIAEGSNVLGERIEEKAARIREYQAKPQTRLNSAILRRFQREHLEAREHFAGANAVLAELNIEAKRAHGRGYREVA